MRPDEVQHAFSNFLATCRADLRMTGYQYSNILRFAEEALAEGYARKNLIAGLRFPFRLEYVSPVGLGAEIACWWCGLHHHAGNAPDQ